MEIVAAKGRDKTHFDYTDPEYRIENIIYIPVSLRVCSDDNDFSEIFYEFADWIAEDDDFLLATLPEIMGNSFTSDPEKIAKLIRHKTGFIVQAACPVRFYNCDTGKYDNTKWSNYHVQWFYVEDIAQSEKIISDWALSKMRWDIDRSFVK